MSEIKQEDLRVERLETARVMAGQIAHDFNNLLTPLLAYPELIRQEVKQNPTVNEYLLIIEKTANEMQALTQKLLSLARRGRVGNEVVSINNLVGQVIQTPQLTIPPGVTVNYDLAPDPLNIFGSRAQMSLALEILCQNALEAMGKSGTLTIKTENVLLDAPVRGQSSVVKGEYVKISLADTGVGIAEDVQGRIFDPFFTTKRANKKRGSGLGLSIVHGIVNDLRGYVDFDSITGKGTTFYLYIPVTQGVPKADVVDPAPKVSPPAWAASSQASGTKILAAPKILIADDEPMIRKLFGMIITSEFREALVDQASDGTEAVGKFSKVCYDLIVMDLQMPGQDGRESFFEIQKICQKNQWPFPPIIFCTGFTPSESLAGIIKDSSVHCLLRKPIKAELLLEAVRTRLRR